MPKEYVTLKISMKSPTPDWGTVLEDIDSCVEEVHWTTAPRANVGYVRITLDALAEEYLNELKWTDNIVIMDETSQEPFA